jgi:TorA maturation chaperone TorD
MQKMDAPEWFTTYADMRSDTYVMLAALLGLPPSEDLLGVLQNLEWPQATPEPLSNALEALRQAGQNTSLGAMKDEFNRLFIGLGTGEMVPYASWYKEKKIQSLPLASLRSSLLELGILRQAGSHESEDHAGALCEIMALISRQSNPIPLPVQANFFQRHIASWIIAFFEDLRLVKDASFYSVVGLFGSRFMELEHKYMNLGEHTPFPIKTRRIQNGNKSIRRQTGVY